VFYVGGIRDVNAFDGALVGELVDGALYYRGVVEWGFRAPDVLELLREAKTPSRSSPFVDFKKARSRGVAGWAAPGRDQLRGDHRRSSAGAVMAGAGHSMT
jgi:hypothetical protein